MVLDPGIVSKGRIEVKDTEELPYNIVGQALKPFAHPLPFSIYFPFDPNNPQITTTVRKTEPWPYKEVMASDGKIRLSYSPNVHEVMLKYYTKEDETGKYLLAIPVLVVDYGTPIWAKYYGTERPPERPIELQYQDWKSGYMLSRSKSPGKVIKVTTVDPCGYKSPRFGCLPKQVEVYLSYPPGYYWVKYPARLLELPPQIAYIERDVIIFTYERPGEADKAIVGKIIDYLQKRKLKKDLPAIISLLNGAGLEVDESLAYEYQGKIYRGIKIFVSEDGKRYEVAIPVRRKTTGQVILALPFLLPRIIMAIVVIGSLLIIKEMVFAWKEVKLAQTNVELKKIYITREVAEQMDKTINEIQQLDVPDEQKADLLNKTLEYYGGIIVELSKDPSGESLFEGAEKYIKYAAIGALGLGLLWLGTKVVGEWRSASRS